MTGDGHHVILNEGKDRGGDDRGHGAPAVKVRDRMIFVPASDIDWVESEGKYVRLHCGSAKHLVREAIGEVEHRLDPREFARIHRRTIVNLRKVTEMYRGFGGDYIVALSSGEKLTVSRRYWSRVRHLGGTK